MNIYDWIEFLETIQKWDDAALLDRMSELDELVENDKANADTIQTIHFLNLELERRFEIENELIGVYTEAVRP